MLSSIFFDRYPNSFSSHVISEDVLSREIIPGPGNSSASSQGGVIRTRRLIVKEGASFLKKVPRWLARLTEIRVVPTLEESIYDRGAHKLTTYTRNLSNRALFTMDERCEYTTDDPTGAMTLLRRQMWITVNYGRFNGLIERVIEMSFAKSVKRTIAGFNERLFERFGPGSSKQAPLLDSPSAKLKEKLIGTTKKIGGFEKA